MALGSSALTIAGWASLLTGVLLVIVGILLVAILFLTGSISVGSAGIFVVLTIGGGPLVALIGAGVIFAARRMMAGYGWARSSLEIFFWLIAISTAAYITYRASRIRGIEATEVFRGTVFYALTGAPSIVLALLLRAESVRDAMTK